MKYEDIKTYGERCDEFQGIVTNTWVMGLLSDEIDELREYIETNLKENK